MGWTFFWLMVVLKIPIIALLWIVYWAIKNTDDPVSDQGDGGSKKPIEPRAEPPRRPRRRGPHGDPALPAPPRTRKRVAARGRRIER